MPADPLTLPVDPATLDRLAAEEWPDAARQHGVDPDRVLVDATRDGTLIARWSLAAGWRGGEHEEPAALRALSSLADALEWRGLVVARDGAAVRVVGWAAAPADPDVEPEWTNACAHPLRRYRGLVRIASLDPWDPRRKAHEDAVAAARLERRAPVAANAKVEHARRVDEMAYGGRRAGR